MILLERKTYINKIIGFVYLHIMKFKKTDKTKAATFLTNFLDNFN